jgi:hypothetical protein
VGPDSVFLKRLWRRKRRRRTEREDDAPWRRRI